MIKIFKYLERKEWLQIGCCLVFIITQVWLDLRLPDYMSEITMLVQTEGSEMSDIWSAGGKMILCAIGSLCAALTTGFFGARIAATLAWRLRNNVYDRVSEFSMEEIGRFSTSSLITRSTNDITQIQTFIAMGMQIIIKAPITAVWAIAKIIGKSWQWSTATATAVLVLILMVGTLIIFAVPRFRIIQTLIDNLNRVTRENLTGLRVVRAYNAEDYQEERFEQANAKLTGTQLFTNRMMAVMMPGMTLVSSGLTLSIYWIGAFLIDGAAMPDRMGLFSDMVVYSSYAMQVVMAFTMLVIIFVLLPRASVSARRINEVLDTEPVIKDGDFSGQTQGTGTVEVRNVSFQYPDAEEPVLHDISFRAEPGETVAFIGATGSGKSTLINLIPRFFDATKGEILVDGVNVKDYKLNDLYNKIGYVSQRPVLFSGTVHSNVAFGDNGKPEATIADVQDAVQTAQAREFVEKMEDGYEAQVSQGGSNLSGGQKQRLSIARAICRKPEIFIFDDSFSALDYRTDKELRQELAGQTAGVTTFIVAQRIGTIRHADKIIVLDEGRTAGIGTHEELMKNCEVYQEIAHSQMSKEELAK